MTENQPLCVATAEGQNLFRELYSVLADNASERNVKENIRGTGLRYIGQGDSRVVLLDETGQYLQTGNACVVKIHKDREVEQNEVEVNTWEQASDGVRRHLLRPTDHADDYSWVVMPYIDTDTTKKKICEMELNFVDEGVDVGDVREPNTARVQDRAVLIDYGRGMRDIDFDRITKKELVHMKKWRWDQLNPGIY